MCLLLYKFLIISNINNIRNVFGKILKLNNDVDNINK